MAVICCRRSLRRGIAVLARVEAASGLVLVVPAWCSVCDCRVSRCVCSAALCERVDAVERVDEWCGPGPVVGDAESVAAPAAHELPRGVQQAVAQSFWFGFGEVAVEDEELGPREEVLRDADEGEPCLVDGEARGGQVVHAGVFGVADASFDASAAAVERFEVGDVVVGAVGDEDLEAVPVDVGEGQLGAGVGVFASGDHPHPVGPPAEIDEVGDLCDLGVFAFLGAVRGDRRLPTTSR